MGAGILELFAVVGGKWGIVTVDAVLVGSRKSGGQHATSTADETRLGWIVRAFN